MLIASRLPTATLRHAGHAMLRRAERVRPAEFRAERWTGAFNPLDRLR
jgi:hypothetical protein